MLFKFIYLNKHHLSSRGHSLCTQFPLKDQTFRGRQNKENINERCAREVLKSLILSAPGHPGQVQIQNTKSLGCSTAQCVNGAIPALSSDRHWTGIVKCLTRVHRVHLFPIHLPTAKFLGIFLKFFIPEKSLDQGFLLLLNIIQFRRQREYCPQGFHYLSKI